MRFEGLDLNLLVLFDALMADRSVTSAARRLHITQPAASAALARLRLYFGDELFIPAGRSLMPTALSKSLETPVREILLRVRAHLVARPEFEPSRSKRHFTLVVSDYASIVLMNDVLRRVHAVAPAITFELIPFDDRPDEKLLRGEVDFLVFPDKDLSNEHPREALFSDEFCCVVWAGNRKVGRRLSLDRYLELGHVSAAFGPTRRVSFEERTLAGMGYRRRIEVIAQSFSMMAAMVVGTDRVATLHSRLARHFARQMPLRLVRAPVKDWRFHESLQWPAPMTGDPALQWLRRLIVETAHGLDDPAPMGRKARGR